MPKDLFDTPEKKADAIAAFESLLEHPGWKLLEQQLDQDIETLRADLETIKDESETKEQIDFQRFKLFFSREQRNKPETMIAELQSDEPKVPDPDPYPTIESEAKKKT